MNPINHNFMISLNTSKINSIQETNPPFNVVHTTMMMIEWNYK